MRKDLEQALNDHEKAQPWRAIFTPEEGIESDASFPKTSYRIGKNWAGWVVRGEMTDGKDPKPDAPKPTQGGTAPHDD